MNTPGEIAKNYLAVGKAKAQLPLGKMFLLAVLAGAYIALAGLGASVASAGAESAGAGRLLPLRRDDLKFLNPHPLQQLPPPGGSGSEYDFHSFTS